MTLIFSFGVLILLVGEAIGTLTELNLEQETLAKRAKGGKSDSLQSDSCLDAMPVNNVTRGENTANNLFSQFIYRQKNLHFLRNFPAVAHLIVLRPN